MFLEVIYLNGLMLYRQFLENIRDSIDNYDLNKLYRLKINPEIDKKIKALQSHYKSIIRR